MPGNKKPRKKYRPKGVIKDPVEYVVSGMKPLTDHKQLLLKTINHGSMRALTSGAGTREDWHNICNLLNVAAIMDEAYFDKAYRDDIQKAMEAHTHCGNRLFEKQRFGYSGLELQAVNTAIEIHDEQIKQATVAEIEWAHKEVQRKLAVGEISFRVKRAV